MSNFVKKKLETKKRKKRSISPGYNWIDKETINPLPELPLENKITADDMNYLHALASLPTSQIKSYGGSLGAAPHDEILLTHPENEVFIYGIVKGTVNNQSIIAVVPGHGMGGVQARVNFTSFLLMNTGNDWRPAFLRPQSGNFAQAFISYYPSRREFSINVSTSMRMMTGANTDIAGGTLTTSSFNWAAVTSLKGGD